MRAEPVDKAEAMVEAMSDADALAMHAEHNKTAWWSARGAPHEGPREAGAGMVAAVSQAEGRIGGGNA